MRRSARPPRPSALLLLAAPLVLAGCSLGPPPTAAVRVAAASLQPFGSCEDLLSYYQDQALAQVGPYGLDSGYGIGVDDVAMEGGDGAESADSAGAAEPAASTHSTTNTQEVGVDEADIVKTDGEVVVTATDGSVRVVDVASRRVLATVDLPRRADGGAAELLLEGQDLVVLTSEWSDWGVYESGTADTMPAFAPQRTVVTRVDLSDPAAPRTLGSVRVEGSYRSARMVDGSVRLVLVSDPTGLRLTTPQDHSLAAEGEAEEENRRLIRASDIDDWIPHLQVLDGSGEVTSTDALAGCDDLHRPPTPSGLSTLSVLTLDVSGEDARPTSTTGVVASAGTVYASTERLVVATNAWDSWGGGGGWLPWDDGNEVSTELHTFDISDPDATDYLASGSVSGWLLNQFSLDEEAGIIRVATTTDPSGSGESSESALVVLREQGGDLVEVGRVDGLGRTEQIYAVRYLSADLAAVVTFRQTDPLYLVSTADPARPEVVGELKIPGYSAYLHPLGEDLLLGVGQDADPETGQTLGTQVSVFDIADPTDPQQVSLLTWPDSYSAVEYDHRAFLHWEPTGQVFLPLESWSPTEDGPSFVGVRVVGVDGDELSDDGEVSTLPDSAQYGDPVQRSMVIGEELWLLTHGELHVADLATLQPEGIVPLR